MKHLFALEEYFEPTDRLRHFGMLYDVSLDKTAFVVQETGGIGSETIDRLVDNHLLPGLLGLLNKFKFIPEDGSFQYKIEKVEPKFILNEDVRNAWATNYFDNPIPNWDSLPRYNCIDLKTGEFYKLKKDKETGEIHELKLKNK